MNIKALNKHKKKKERKPSLGEASLKLQKKTGSGKGPNSIELEREINKGSNSKKSYEEEVYETIQRALKDDKIINDFFIQVLFVKHRLCSNVMIRKFCYHQNCPSSNYDQTLYKYHIKTGRVEYLWTVPDIASCHNLPLMRHSLTLDHLTLLSFIEDFKSGELDRQADKLNNQLSV